VKRRFLRKCERAGFSQIAKSRKSLAGRSDFERKKEEQGLIVGGLPYSDGAL
jgi:hypothetical protein